MKKGSVWGWSDRRLNRTNKTWRPRRESSERIVGLGRSSWGHHHSVASQLVAHLQKGHGTRYNGTSYDDYISKKWWIKNYLLVYELWLRRAGSGPVDSCNFPNGSCAPIWWGENSPLRHFQHNIRVSLSDRQHRIQPPDNKKKIQNLKIVASRRRRKSNLLYWRLIITAHAAPDWCTSDD